MMFLNKLKIECATHPAALLPHTRVNKLSMPKITAVKIWGQPWCSLTDGWIKKMWYGYMMGYYSGF
jgi:hypothetical protein